jgi:hypothetical protein
MKCTHCQKEIINELEAILVSSDGDFVCSKKCKEDREREMEHFYNEVLPDDQKFAAWLGVPTDLL